MKKHFYILFAAILAMTSHVSVARAGGPFEVREGNYNSMDPNRQASMQTIANESQKNNKSGSAWGYLSAALAFAGAYMWFSKCYSTTPAGWGFCALGVVSAGAGIYSLLQVLKTDKAAKQSYDMCAAVTVGPGCGTGPDQPTVPPGDPSTTTTIPMTPEEQEVFRAIRQLEQNGIVIDPNKGTITDRSGKTFDFSDPSKGIAQMNQSGYPATMDQFNNAASEFQKQAAEELGTDNNTINKDGLGYIEGGGAGGGAGATGAADGVMGEGFAPFQRSPTASNARNPAAAQGLSRSLNGEPIGVSQDNLFGMMSRRYDLQESRGYIDPLLQAPPSRK